MPYLIVLIIFISKLISQLVLNFLFSCDVLTSSALFVGRASWIFIVSIGLCLIFLNRGFYILRIKKKSNLMSGDTDLKIWFQIFLHLCQLLDLICQNLLSKLIRKVHSYKCNLFLKKITVKNKHKLKKTNVVTL